MVDRSVSVPLTLCDLERPDARNQIFFQMDLITLVRSAASLHWHKASRGATAEFVVV